MQLCDLCGSDLIYWEDKLACVPGVGVAYGLQAQPDEPGLEIIWQDSAYQVIALACQ